MANRRNSSKDPSLSRDAGGFIALPWSVIDCPAYSKLSHPARSLLLEIDRQYVRDNNGRLLASFSYLRQRGWTSSDTITKAKRQLLNAGFIHETVKGCRPNKASWYAVTWRTLDWSKRYDEGAVETFIRGAYEKNVLLRPSQELKSTLVAPFTDAAECPSVPPDGAIKLDSLSHSRPPHGNHLEEPSAYASGDQ